MTQVRPSFARSRKRSGVGIIAAVMPLVSVRWQRFGGSIHSWPAIGCRALKICGNPGAWPGTSQPQVSPAREIYQTFHPAVSGKACVPLVASSGTLFVATTSTAKVLASDSATWTVVRKDFNATGNGFKSLQLHTCNGAPNFNL